MSKKTIGILGGLGPESTGRFYLDLINKFSKKFHVASNTDYPHIVINSIPASELIYGNNKKILNQYVAGLKFLDKSKVDKIAIICNTAYLYLNNFQRKIKTPIISLPKEVGKYLLDNNVKSVAILGSKAAIKSGLYKHKGIKNISLTNLEINQLSKTINNYNLGRNKQKQINFVKKIYKKYSRRANLIILGCSEIALMLKNQKNTLNPMELLIDSLLDDLSDNFFTKKKSKIHGQGVFTKKPIKKENIFYTVSTNHIINKPQTRYARIGKNEFVDDKILNWINHSCEPNTKLVIGKSPKLIALKNIPADEEIVCNYNSTEIGGKKVNCTCKTKECKSYFKRVE